MKEALLSILLSRNIDATSTAGFALRPSPSQDQDRDQEQEREQELSSLMLLLVLLRAEQGVVGLLRVGRLISLVMVEKLKVLGKLEMDWKFETR